MKKLVFFLLISFSGSLFAQTGPNWQPIRYKASFRDSTYIAKSLRIAGEWRIGPVTITTNGVELNLLDGLLANHVELNKLVGIGVDTISTRAYVRAYVGGGGAPGVLVQDDSVHLQNQVNYVTKYVLKSANDLKVNISDTATMLTKYLHKQDTNKLSNRINLKVNISDTASMLTKYLHKQDTNFLSTRINLKVNIADTASMLTNYINTTPGTTGNVLLSTGTDWESSGDYSDIGSLLTYVGTTAVSLNRTSGALALTGITSIDGTAVSNIPAGDIGNVMTSNGSIWTSAIPTGSAVQKMQFRIDTTAGAPATGDSILTQVAFIDKHIEVFRNGGKEYQNTVGVPNITDGIRFNDATGQIIFRPTFSTNEKVIIEVSHPDAWEALNLASSTLLNGLISAWDLDEAAGNAIDLKAVNNLVLTGGTRSAAGKIGTSFAFVQADHPDNDYLGGVDATYELASLSVSCWVNTSVNNVYQGPIANWTASGGVHGWKLELTDQGATMKAVFTVLNHSETPEYGSVTSVASISTGVWHHFVGTFDGSTVRLYVDGSASGSPSSWAHAIAYAAENNLFTVGAQNIYGEAGVTGSIDMVRIYNRALTSVEVTEIYTKENTGTTYPW